MLEVGGVVDAGCEHDHVRVVDSGRGGIAQGLQQLVRVFADRLHAHRVEELGQGLRHDAPVRDDVADTRGHPHVVFEHAHLAVLVADEVDAGDLDAHTVGRMDARGLAVEVLRARDEGGGQHPVAHTVLATVGVVEEGLERLDALLHALLDPRPLVVGDDARHRVERERALFAGEVEGHALRQVRAGERLGAPAQLFLRQSRERLMQLFVRRTRRSAVAGVLGRLEHLVERRHPRRGLARRECRAVAVEQITHAASLVGAVFRECDGCPGHPGLRRRQPARTRRSCSTAQSSSVARTTSGGAIRIVCPWVSFTSTPRCSSRSAISRPVP